ncbi:HAD-like domain protein [Metarhizium album ARSEF 1941]|uniref:HAD-like domain protein n=1 Tax=Metarhizium album (strain ARSEF 1941) TaxID=1081103 RepID=A0A0B2WKG9_METAS|nr:HAD-like domain protein [Metarhizium album ARSEF 1941]KHN94159.1 HAD-like domain protein [Metarhizium album ARSEF 1941]
MVRVNAKVSQLLSGRKSLETMVVVDADKTLYAEDTAKMFWDVLGSASPLQKLFGGPLGYSETAFLQAVVLYEEAADEAEFERVCDVVASRTEIHAEFKELFGMAATENHVGVVVVTCGIRRVWDKVLQREGLSRTVQVIGGSRISDDMVVTPEVKARIVARLQREEKVRVWAIGDSPLDLPMLEAADEAIVVTGEEQHRSRSMDDALLEAIKTRGLRARQALLPSNASPRLSYAVLPRIRLTNEEFLRPVFSRRRRLHQNVWHATAKDAAKVLMAPTRDASVAGPRLRKAHADIGLYLAWGFLPELLGVEEYPMQHVQGHQIMGHRLRHERETTIVALMRGGEPLALALNEALPLAMFLHAISPDDIKPHHVENQKTVILVDSVINSGQTLIKFVQHTRRLRKDVRIVAVAGVVHADAVSQGHALAGIMEQHGVHIGALRLSENKFTGFKGTDTGHRLFNTTHLA